MSIRYQSRGEPNEEICPFPFSAGIVGPAAYQRWLVHKTRAHIQRDRKRGNLAVIGEAYRTAIHMAVSASNGNDAYTGKAFDSSLLSHYRNAESAHGKRSYKHGFALLPTVNHIGDGLGFADSRPAAGMSITPSTTWTCQLFLPSAGPFSNTMALESPILALSMRSHRQLWRRAQPRIIQTSAKWTRLRTLAHW